MFCMFLSNGQGAGYRATPVLGRPAPARLASNEPGCGQNADSDHGRNAGTLAMVRPHRHSDENLPQVGKMLGHRSQRSTAGYAHLADSHLVETTERVSRLVAEGDGRACFLHLCCTISASSRLC